MIAHKVELDKEIREGWTLRDFVNEIDDLIHDVMFGRSILRTPRNYEELKICIDNFIPKHMFTHAVQEKEVVSELAKYYADKYGYEE